MPRIQLCKLFLTSPTMVLLDKPGDLCYAAMAALTHARKRVASALGNMQSVGLVAIETRMRREKVAQAILDACRRSEGYVPYVQCGAMSKPLSPSTWGRVDVYDPNGVVAEHMKKHKYWRIGSFMTNAAAIEANEGNSCDVFYLAVHQAASAQEE